MPGASATCSSPISARIGAFMPRRLGLLLTVCLTICTASSAGAACIDLKQKDPLSFQGRLNYRIFPGPPNYEDVRKGDTPEPTYILKLEEPICATGNEFVDPNTKFDRIQIFPESDKAAQALWRDLRGFIGQRVLVAGTGAFGRHTGHHHAPLMLPIASISSAFDPTKSHGTSMTTVQGFYLALAPATVRKPQNSWFLKSDRRDRCPQSPSATSTAIWLNRSLSSMWFPLVRTSIAYAIPMWRPLVDAVDGEALVRTTKVGGLNLIDSIKAVGGC